MNIQIAESPGDLLLSIDGRAGIDESDELASAFRKALESGAPLVRLALSGLSAVDVSFLQLLLSLELSLSRGGRSLALRPLPAGHVLLQVADLLGINVKRLLASKTESA